MAAIEEVRIEGHGDVGAGERVEGKTEGSRPARRQGGRGVLMEQGKRGGWRSRRGRGPRQRCEAKEYDAKRPPPERKSVEHAT